MLLLDLLKALKKGEELENTEVWKNAQVLATCLSAIIIPPIHYLPVAYTIPDNVANSIIYAIAAICAAFNVFVTYASSKKVGI